MVATDPSLYASSIIPHPNIKSEDTSSPGFTPVSLTHFQFRFPLHPHYQTTSLYPSLGSSIDASYLDASEAYASVNDSAGARFESPGSADSCQSSLSPRQLTNTFPMDAVHMMSLPDEWDEAADVVGTSDSVDGTALDPNLSGSLSQQRAVRRRSSKACDQCRRSKCKCEQVAPGRACRSCLALGTSCTFLGPTRKRGPPKGYIDVIEARMHQAEALLGIFLDSQDERAKGLLSDLSKDVLAREILNRVDNSPYGVKGRQQGEKSGAKTKTHATSVGSSGSGLYSHMALGPSGSQSPWDGLNIENTHPSNEWQDRVSNMLRAIASSHGGSSDDYPSVKQHVIGGGSEMTSDTNHSQPSPGRRLRRKLNSSFDGRPGFGSDSYKGIESPHSAQGYLQPAESPSPARHQINLGSWRSDKQGGSDDSLSDSESSEEVIEGVGQLSLNEDEQVRYHGKASGLYLLELDQKADGRNEGGIWRFPKARVWPPLPGSTQVVSNVNDEDEFANHLPDKMTQEYLLELYFTYVHPALPLIHKRAFFDVFRNGAPGAELSSSPDVTSNSSMTSSSPFNRRPRRIPVILLFAMFAIAARYVENDPSNPPPPDGSMMWSAGDKYLDFAKILLDRSYASSRASTCQALLLMGYREIGIGAMALAWTYVGMAIRMAQDLGMHRSSDGWARQSLGKLFNDSELSERKRIWYACVIMDKYVSTYIGRPLAIFDQDFDTPLPSEGEQEEMEEWTTRPVSVPAFLDPTCSTEAVHVLAPGRVISCFNASSSLSGILSQIVRAIYAVCPINHDRQSETLRLGAQLDLWYLELPKHLRHEPGSMKPPVPLPHVLTLHMQYWCAALLLHRPSIRHVIGPKHRPVSESSDGVNVRAAAEKSYELCASAANHITSILSLYMETYCMKRASVFLCYYVFTASIMHVTALTTYPAEPQATVGLAKCMEALHKMEIVWPSAGRALELLRGSKVNLKEAEIAKLSNHPHGNKRSAEYPLDDAFEEGHSRVVPFSYVVTETSQPRQAYAAPSYTVGSTDPLLDPLRDWPANSVAGMPAFTEAPSTSMFPQEYSTGLMHEPTVRPQVLAVRNPPQSTTPQVENADQNRSLPQVWNDYATFSQFGYPGMIPMSQNQQQTVAQSDRYLPGQHDVYGAPNRPPPR